MYAPIYLSYHWLLTEQFCIEMLRFQSQYFQLKNGTSENGLRFKVKVLKTFKTSSDCHIKTYRSLKRRAILKIPATVF